MSHFSASWKTFWRVLAAGELLGFVGSGIVASLQFGALHVTWVYLVAHPDLLLSSSVSFVTDALICLVLCAGLFLTVPIVVVSEWLGARGNGAPAEIKDRGGSFDEYQHAASGRFRR